MTKFANPSISRPFGIVVGSDGALWFTNSGSDSIGRITTGGAITAYTGTGIATPEGIALGSDGALWFTNHQSWTIGRITTTGVVSIYTGDGVTGPQAIAAGPDGALWFVNTQYFPSIGRITTAGKVTANYPLTSGYYPYYLVAGPDKALWFGDYETNSIGRISTTGTITHYNAAGIAGPVAIARGSDGALWFTLFDNGIGRITTNVTPAITGFSPTKGAVGTTVTITGKNLSSTTRVTFDGAPATIISVSATQVVATVPAGGTSGHIAVTTRSGTTTSADAFKVT